MQIVIGPTPPGTGVIAAARSLADSNSTSPHSLPLGKRLTPTSITTAPGLIQSPRTNRAFPIATTKTSARPTSSRKLAVREWQIVTVACFSSSISATGLPTILLRPTTTAFFPLSSQPTAASSFMKAIDVFIRRNCLQDFFRVDMRRERQLHQDAMNLVILVELVHQCQQFFFRD